jgi:hypothetical protein
MRDWRSFASGMTLCIGYVGFPRYRLGSPADRRRSRFVRAFAARSGPFAEPIARMKPTAALCVDKARSLDNALSAQLLVLKPEGARLNAE